MNKQQGRGGMGIHKHGVSGTPGLPPGLKQWLAREQNRRRKKRKHYEPMYGSIEALMRNEN